MLRRVDLREERTTLRHDRAARDWSERTRDEHVRRRLLSCGGGQRRGLLVLLLCAAAARVVSRLELLGPERCH